MASNPPVLAQLARRSQARCPDDARLVKAARLYRYYVSQAVLKHGPGACPVGRVPAAEIETAVVDQLRGLLRAPEIIVGTWRAARSNSQIR